MGGGGLGGLDCAWGGGPLNPRGLNGDALPPLTALPGDNGLLDLPDFDLPLCLGESLGDFDDSSSVSASITKLDFLCARAMVDDASLYGSGALGGSGGS